MVFRRRPQRGAQTPPPAGSPPATAQTPEIERPEPPAGARHLIILVLDSLRYDSWTAAAPPVLGRLGSVERRHSYATWTAPSHYNLLMGLLPHTSPPRVYASEHYKADYLRYAERLGTPGVEFKSLLPSLFLPTYLRRSLGYRTRALVSMPVLNRFTPINCDFDHYELMPHHNDLGAIIDRLDFSGGRPTFHLLNTGETHYPYAPVDEDPSLWPRISGVHGVVKRLDEAEAGVDSPGFFDAAQMLELQRRQVRAVTAVDGLMERLFDIVPDNTWLIVTSDHGELFGEDGYFGHGPINHPKVLEVPFVEGRIR
jgi:hypothetical protein